MLQYKNLNIEQESKFWLNAERDNYTRLKLIISLMLLASIINLCIQFILPKPSSIQYFSINGFFTFASALFLIFRLVVKQSSHYRKSILYHYYSTAYIFIIGSCAGMLAGQEIRPMEALFFYTCGLIVPGVLLLSRLWIIIASSILNTAFFILFTLIFHTQSDFLSFIYVVFGFCSLIIATSIIIRQLHIRQYLTWIELEQHNENLELILQKRTAELITAKEKAEESDRLKSAFISNLNHELRTPLNGIVGFVSLLSENNHSPEKVKRYIKLIQSNSAHLLKIVSDILDIARIQSNQIVLKFEPVSAYGIIKKLQNYCDQEIIKLEKTDITIIFDENSPDVILNTDNNRLSQVLQNIVSNSIKFTSKGHVRIGYTAERQNIVFTISDTGVGIPYERIKSIFEPFRQGDDSFTRAHQGTGLGLAIAYQLVKLIGGDILVNSVLNEGTSFSIIINQCIIENLPVVAKTE